MVVTVQPIAAADVAALVAGIATAPACNAVVDIGGPDKISFAELARVVLDRQRVRTPVVVDPAAEYFGTPLDRTSLVTGTDAVLGSARFS